MYISLYVVVNTFIGGRQPQNKLMRLRTFQKMAPNEAKPTQTTVIHHGAKCSYQNTT